MIQRLFLSRLIRNSGSKFSVKLPANKRLRGIHAAWHFWFAVSFGGESGVRKLGLGGIHPLT
ncbi:DUF3265 domain-containing protein, partial [Vibrio vulnificus]|nr:DUF3265 domain-containing protein [Vibrio vulnificus]EGQ9971811.1 DUF3265 domain-containing protein [Vibrio vulnificus]